MISFLQTLLDFYLQTLQDLIPFFRAMQYNPLLLTGLIAGALAGLASGVVGPYVVTRRIVFLSGAIAHIAVGGIGAVVWLSWAWPEAIPGLHPIHGAIVAALAGAVIIGLVHQRAGERTDTLIGALWAVGMTTGIMLIKFTPGYENDLMAYLFGSISMVSWSDVWLLLVLDVIIIVITLLFHKRFLALCLDPTQTSLQGVNVTAVHLVMLCLVALTVVTLTYIVGLILVIALICLPAAAASRFTRRMSWLILVTALLSICLTTVPRIAVYGTKISAESAIVLAAAAVYVLAVAVDVIRRKRSSSGTA